MRKNFSHSYVLQALCISLAFVICFAFQNVFASTTNGTIDATYKYAKVCDDSSCTASSTINFAPTGSTAITIVDANALTAAVTGYAWGSTLGWINMAPTGSGVTVNISTGAMSGYAWSGTSGYINFAPTGYGVTIDASGQLTGYAWTGGVNGGWIKFDCSSNATCVKTDWRPTAGRAVVAPSGGGGGGGGGGSFIVSPQATSTTKTTNSATTQSGPQNQKNGDYTNLYRADVNDSNVVDIFDYNSLMVNWSKTSTINSTQPKSDRCKTVNVADVNCDGRIDLLDFNIIMIYWGQKVIQSSS